MIDPFVFLAPFLLLAVLALLQFVGCQDLFDVASAGPLGPPTFDPPPGSVPQGQVVTVAGDTDPIYFTTNGDDPTDPPSGATQTSTGPASITILASVTIKAIHIEPEDTGSDSMIASGAYTVSPAFRQVASADMPTSQPTSVTAAFSMDVIAGNAIVVWIWYNNNAASVQNVQDTVGSVYQMAVPPTTGVGALANWRQEIWYAVAVAGGPIQVTANFTGPAFTNKKALFAHEYAGMDPTAPFEAGTGAAGAGAAVGATISSGTVTTSGKLVFGAAITSSSGAAGAGFTARATTPEGPISEDQFSPPPGVVAASFLLPDGADWVAQVATFR